MPASLCSFDSGLLTVDPRFALIARPLIICWAAPLATRVPPAKGRAAENRGPEESLDWARNQNVKQSQSSTMELPASDVEGSVKGIGKLQAGAMEIGIEVDNSCPI